MQQRRAAKFIVPNVPEASAANQAMILGRFVDWKPKDANVWKIYRRRVPSLGLKGARKVVLVFQSTSVCGGDIDRETLLLVELAHKLQKIRFGSAHGWISKAVT